MRVIDEKNLYEIALELVKRSSTRIAPDAMFLLRQAYQREKKPSC
jgi:tartrate dehydratase alpha subunit/fumarate hydratase class I-like protein